MKVSSKIILALGFACAMLTSECLSAQPGPGTGYPYVKEGTNIIVNRDEYGGVKKEKLFSTRSSDKLETNEADTLHMKLPGQFEVAYQTGAYTYADAKSCSEGWRMPTYREGLLIMLVNPELATPVPSDVYFFTSTYLSSTGLRYVVKWNSTDKIGNSGLKNFLNFLPKLRVCIRDIDTSSLGLSDL